MAQAGSVTATEISQSKLASSGKNVVGATRMAASLPAAIPVIETVPLADIVAGLTVPPVPLVMVYPPGAGFVPRSISMSTDQLPTQSVSQVAACGVTIG